MWNLDRLFWWTYVQGSKGDADIGNRLADTGGEGEVGTNWESSMETYTLPYLKLDSGKLLYDSESSNWVLCDNVEGWDGVGGGVGGSRRREHTYTYGQFMLILWQKPTQYCKAIILQLKKLFLKNDIKKTI